MFSKLMRMLGKKEPSSSAQAAASESAVPGKKGEVKDLENFVDYVVRSLVDKPEAVRIEKSELENSTTVIKINCAKEDIGKVIGKSGRTIMAIRSLVSGAGGRIGKRLSVEVMD